MVTKLTCQLFPRPAIHVVLGIIVALDGFGAGLVAVHV